MKSLGQIVLLLCLVNLSCNTDTGDSVRLSTDTLNSKNLIVANTIDNLDYTDYALSSDAQNVVVEWEKYNELANQIEYLKKADLSFFNGEKKVLKTFLEEFATTIPEQLQTNPILSRSVIVETELLKLNENLTLDNISRSDKLANIKSLLEAFSNLNYQINKKMEFDRYDSIMPE